MGDKSGIEWTDATWNPIVGCSIVSPGCTHCYAMQQAARIERMTPGSHYAGTTQASKAGSVWTGKLARAPEHICTLPLRWRKPRRIFVNSMGDLFHEAVPDAWIDGVFAIMALAPQHTFQILTKRAARMRTYMAHPEREALWMNAVARALDEFDLKDREHPILGRSEPWLPLPNVWLGVSAEDQARADERIPDLLETPAAVRFVSAEPLLGPLEIDVWLRRSPSTAFLAGMVTADMPDWTRIGSTALDWIIVGGESGPGARPMHPNWARDIRDQCSDAGVPFFFKQWGSWQPGHYSESRRAILFDPSSGPDHGMTLEAPPHPADYVHQWGGAPGVISVRRHKSDAGRLLDGVEHNALPGARP